MMSYDVVWCRMMSYDVVWCHILAYFGIFWYFGLHRTPHFPGVFENPLTFVPRSPDWHAIWPKTQRIWTSHDLLLLWLSSQILKWPASSFFFIFCNDQKAGKHPKRSCFENLMTTYYRPNTPEYPSILLWVFDFLNFYFRLRFSIFTLNRPVPAW